MNRVTVANLLSIQPKTTNIRNFCILAHVDHGKTTLSDSLVSSNGIISQKLAGKLRFLDSTEEEQKRGITMHSSAISLLYVLEDKSQAERNSEEYLVNLVDSPGHIDFSSDVSTATRLCDGALIIIDVLEGICTQTHAVLYKALKERMQPCLVLNKIDRLIIEMRMSSTEAYQHLRRIIENVNALAFTLMNSELIKRTEETGVSFPQNIIDSLTLDWTFSPEKGNVIFASALDCWGFGLMKFVNSLSRKLGLNKQVLKKYLFEDFSFNSDTKKILKYDASNQNSKPMFASMVLDPIWHIYETAIVMQNPKDAANFAKQQVSLFFIIIFWFVVTIRIPYYNKNICIDLLYYFVEN
jgi:ribosome assembly protein 1